MEVMRNMLDDSEFTAGAENMGGRGQLPLHFVRWGAMPPTFYLLLL